MIKPLKHTCLLLVAAALASCGSSESPSPEGRGTSPSVVTEQVPVSNPAPAPTEMVSRERVLRAMRCQILLSQMVGVAMTNADTGLPPDLVSRLKASAVARWQNFADAHAQAAGVQASDHKEIIAELNTLSSSADDRQRSVDNVRDCLDSEP